MRVLRAPDGCPWDREQTHESLRSYLLEEAAEATDALAYGTRSEFAGELGDVLLQVAFHSVIAEEEGSFTYEDVEDAIVTKLIRRHPHVFGDVVAETPDAVRENWLKIKEEERAGQPRSATDSVPRSLPALMRAQQLAEKLGWEPAGLPAGVTAQEAAALIVELAVLAARAGSDVELAVLDELEKRSAAGKEAEREE